MHFSIKERTLIQQCLEMWPRNRDFVFFASALVKSSWQILFCFNLWEAGWKKQLFLFVPLMYRLLYVTVNSPTWAEMRSPSIRLHVPLQYFKRFMFGHSSWNCSVCVRLSNRRNIVCTSAYSLLLGTSSYFHSPLFYELHSGLFYLCT